MAASALDGMAASALAVMRGIPGCQPPVTVPTAARAYRDAQTGVLKLGPCSEPGMGRAGLVGASDSELDSGATVSLAWACKQL